MGVSSLLGSPSPFPAAGRIPNPPIPSAWWAWDAEDGVERGHPLQEDPCGIVGGSFWRLGEQLYFTLVFACPACASVSHSARHICVSPVMQRPTPLPCPTPALRPAVPRAPESYLSTHIHCSRCSSSGRDSAMVSSLCWGLTPISSSLLLQSPNKQPNPQAEQDGLCGFCHGDP